ncbi:MAG: hypothetical protein HYS33_08695 [Acidobacteria bacterium]|nr:hypothetical protein [Acidobacteriota bacterium]
MIRQQTAGPRTRIVACVAGLLASGCYLYSTGPFQFPSDDSYITLEFARNFAATGRFTFDGVHPAPGATSPLHVLLLALASRLGFGLAAADVALGILFFLLAVERTGALAWRLTQSRPAVILSSTLTALSGYLIYDSLNGLETTLFIFLALAWVASVIAFFEDRAVKAGTVLWLFLALLTRPEALWLAASVGAYLLLRAFRVPNERNPLARLLTSLAGAGALAIFTQWALTGSAFPHTALAKVYLFGDFRRPLGERFTIFWQGLREVWSPLYFFLLLGIWARRGRVIFWMLMPWLVVTEALFCLLIPGQVATYWGRYQHPLMPFVFVLAGEGFETAARWLVRFRVGKATVAITAALVVMLCFINLREFRQNLEDDKQVIFKNHFWSVAWLREHAPTDIRVATHDIGVLRYEGGYNLLDLSGLVNRQAFERNREGAGQFEYLSGQRPDYVIGIDFWLEGYLHTFPQLNCCCRRVAHAEPRTPTPIRLSIFQCDWEGSEATLPPDPDNSSRR